MTAKEILLKVEARADDTRARAITEGLLRFPADGRGPLRPDRYILPRTLLVDDVRATRGTR